VSRVVMQEQDPLGDLTAAFFLQLHQQGEYYSALIV
jgi:hypothetical protein